MTITRAVLIFVVGVLVADYHFGNGRLLQAVSAQATDLGYTLSSEFSKIERRIAPTLH